VHAIAVQEADNLPGRTICGGSASVLGLFKKEENLEDEYRKEVN
jgi:hypothetical protein